MKQEVTAKIGTLTIDLKNIIVQVIEYFNLSKFESRQQIIAKLFKKSTLDITLMEVYSPSSTNQTSP